MSKSKTKIFEFLTLFTMVIGTVIGTGIYVKNKDLLTETHNPIIAIILWLVVGIVLVGAVYVFLEISSATKHLGNGTIGNWSKLFINRKSASLFSLMYLIVYVPSCQSIFTMLFVTYIFQIVGVNLPPATLFAIYLLVGVSMIVIFLFINMYSANNVSRKIQVFGTVFKFVPLVIALFAGFILAGPNGAMQNEGNIIGNTAEWSTSNFDAGLFLRGFGGILFSFDGFIYIANAQKTAKHKEVVPAALMSGMIFVALFYVVMAISLFLGSPDGSIESLLQLVFGGESAKTVANVMTNIFSILIAFLGINIFSYIGVVGLESDAQVGLVYSKKGKMNFSQAGYKQMIASVVIYVIFLMMGMLLSEGAWKGFSTSTEIPNYLNVATGAITKYTGIMSSTASCLSFIIIVALIVASIINRKTGKVKVDKMKWFLPVAYISAIAIGFFVIMGIATFIMPAGWKMTPKEWINSSGFVFVLLLTFNLSIIGILYFLQERCFKIHGEYPETLIEIKTENAQKVKIK